MKYKLKEIYIPEYRKIEDILIDIPNESICITMNRDKGIYFIYWLEPSMED